MVTEKNNQLAINIISDVLSVDPKELDGDSGIATVAEWDSIRHVSVILAVEQVIGRQLETEEIMSATTIQGIGHVLEATMG